MENINKMVSPELLKLNNPPPLGKPNFSQFTPPEGGIMDLRDRNMPGKISQITQPDLIGIQYTRDELAPGIRTVDPIVSDPNTITSVADAAVATNTSAGFTATTGTQGILTAGATRVRGMHGVSSSTAGALILRNTSQSGTKLLEIDTPAAAGQVDPYIPDEGIRFRDGAYIDISAGYDSATIFFDG